MTDGPVAAPAPASTSTTATYARIYEEQQPRLVAYARSLTRNVWAAEDIVAEAHFRVWRRLSDGHEIDNVPAYLMTTVRHLAAAAGSSTRETPRDPQDSEQVAITVHRDDPADPAERVSSVDLLVRVLGQLPERWVKALWLAEAEGEPLAAVGSQIGAGQGATAVLLHRAREGMRQAFLQTQTGAPDDPACEVHWVRMPAYVRGAATSRQSGRLLGHVDTCDDCRRRLAVLMRANDRLPALVGPALLVFVLGGAGRFLLPFATGSAGVVATAGGHGGGGVLHGIRHAVTGGSKAPAAAAAAAAGVAAVLCLALGSGHLSPSPSPRVPLADAPVGTLPPSLTAEAAPGEDRGTGTGKTAPPAAGTGGPDPAVAPFRADDSARAEEAPTATGGTNDDTPAPDTSQPTPTTPGGQEEEPTTPREGNPGAPPEETPEPGPEEPGYPPSADPEPTNPGTEEPEPVPADSQPETPPSTDPKPETPCPLPADPEPENPPSTDPEPETPPSADPETENPDTDTPGDKDPAPQLPGTETPSTDTPGADTPGSPGPGDLPEAETPPSTDPEPENPDTETPGDEDPAPQVPDAETPFTDTPGADSPGSPGPGDLPEGETSVESHTTTPAVPGPVDESSEPGPEPGGPGGDC